MSPRKTSSTPRDEFPALTLLGLKACDTRGDGNCLFSAFSDQIYGHPGQHNEIRARVVQYMRDNSTFFRQFVPVDPVRRNPKRKNVAASMTSSSTTPATEDEKELAFEKHLQMMARGGVWGDNIEIQAFVGAYQTEVKIYMAHLAEPLHMKGEGQSTKPVVHIAYHDWEHYSTVRNITGPFKGLPMIKDADLSAGKAAELKASSNGVVIQDWMIKAVSTSLPDITDEGIIVKALEDHNGRVNDAVSKILDSMYSSSSSTPSTPASSSQSSVERDTDDDDEDEVWGPNKRQNRKIMAAKAKRSGTIKKSNNPIVQEKVEQSEQIEMQDKPVETIEISDVEEEGETAPEQVADVKALYI